MKKSTDFILSSSFSRFVVCSLSIKVLLRVGRYLPSRVPAEFREIKAETHDATNRCDTSPRQVAATNRLVWHVKIIVAATEFCRCDLSHEFKLV